MLGWVFKIRDFYALNLIELSFFFFFFGTCLLKLTLFLTNAVIASEK